MEQHMSDAANHAGNAGHALIVVKTIASSPAGMGILAGVVGFMFDWPATRKEGFCRLSASAVCSHFFGDAVLRTIINFMPWIPIEEIRTGAYLLAGLPAWFLLSALFHYFKKNQKKDIVRIVKGLKK